jgi:hypothetical protein
MNEALKNLINLLDGAGYKVCGVDVDSLIQPQKDGVTRDIIRVRLAVPEPVKTITREEFDKLTPEQKSEFLAERGRIA